MPDQEPAGPAGHDRPSGPASGPAGPAAAPSLARGGSVVAPAVLLLNLSGYLLALVAARSLAPAAFGELNALLGVLLVASVPALALQAVVAQAVVRGPASGHEAALLRRAAVSGLVVGGIAALAAPLVGAFLHVGLAGPLWLAAGLVPLAVQSAAAGVLQGRERFRALSGLLVVQALAKAAGVLPLLLDAGPAAVLAVLALSTTATAAVGVALTVGRGRRRGHHEAPGPPPGARALLAATGGLLAFLLLANLDLVLARHVLPRAASGDYGVGAVCAKVALWLPQAVVVVVFPRLSDPAAGRLLLRRAATLLAALGALEVAGALLLGRPALRLAFGSGYQDVAPVLPLFVLLGAALAVAQLLLYHGIATTDALPARALLLAAALEAALAVTLRPSTTAGVVLLACGCVLPATGWLVARGLRSRRTTPS